MMAFGITPAILKKARTTLAPKCEISSDMEK